MIIQFKHYNAYDWQMIIRHRKAVGNSSKFVLRVTSGFHHGVNEICALLGFYITRKGNGSFLPNSRVYLAVPSSRVQP